MSTHKPIPKTFFALLIVITIAISGLNLELSQKQAKLEEEFMHTKNKLIQIEKLYNVTLGPNKEFPSDTLITSGYWFNYYSDVNYTSGSPYICVYVQEDNLTFEIFIEVENAPSPPHLTIQMGTPYSGDPIPDLFIGFYKERFQTFTFNAPSAGWYTVSVVGHVSPKWTKWSPPGYDAHTYTRIRLLSEQKPILFGVGLGQNFSH